ncbi:metallophosphoesterase family protein [Desulfobacterium sp. N47]|uniref:Calcineurin-like phosphoesterase domain-containing protein n=1 Tax=uncultured Desulfobacterium sp. TaxID=201089 RepID=E1YHW9_9BACT|nr:hypothetical protein N47_D30470 [uncultured Desulfobacterium sp.]
MKKMFCKISVILMLAVLIAVGSVSAEPWKFGVISDTQWTKADDGKNPNTCAADIIKQVDQQFIASGVKLVVHVGDMVDSGSQINDYTRALYAQDLYNAGIGFYPLRGNHEAAHGSYLDSGADYRYAYPQIVPGPDAGVNNDTPGDITSAIIPAADLNPITGNPPADKTNPNTFTAGADFSAPDAVNAYTGGVSYSFRYNNATFVLLDQFKSPDYYTSYVPDQQPWIDETLLNRPAHTHAFAFTHKNILGGNHKDNMFGGQVTPNDPGDGYGLDIALLSPAEKAALEAKQDAENAFFASMQDNLVKYVISGHDHHHYNSVVTSPDGLSKVHQLITQSDSSKFYTPGLPVSANDVPVEQDLSKIGYYIFTVDGPRVTIDYYADDHDDWTGSSPVTTPTLNFSKRSSTGYSLNGKENIVAQGASYVMTDNTSIARSMEHGFAGTSMAILDGINGSTATTNYGKATEKAVNTGWAPQNMRTGKHCDDPASDILILWGMADLGTEQTDVYTLSMSYDHHKLLPIQLGKGMLGLATKNENGEWVNAVDMNSGGAKKFILGPWKPGYKLGTYGINLKTHTAWAVIDRAGDFAVAGFRHFR